MIRPPPPATSRHHGACPTASYRRQPSSAAPTGSSPAYSWWTSSCTTSTPASVLSLTSPTATPRNRETYRFSARSGPKPHHQRTDRTELLQRMSGIATLTSQFAVAADFGVHVLDTRKTTPGLRALDGVYGESQRKKVVGLCGGGAAGMTGPDPEAILQVEDRSVGGGWCSGTARAVRFRRAGWVSAGNDVDGGFSDTLLLHLVSPALSPCFTYFAASAARAESAETAAAARRSRPVSFQAASRAAMAGVGGKMPSWPSMVMSSRRASWPTTFPSRVGQGPLPFNSGASRFVLK